MVETRVIGYKRIPIRFSWRTNENVGESADSVEYRSDSNDTSSSVPQETIDAFRGSKQAKVLQ